MKNTNKNWITKGTNYVVGHIEQDKELEKQQQGYSEEEVLELIQFLSDNQDFKDYSSISIFTAEDFLNKFKNK